MNGTTAISKAVARTLGTVPFYLSDAEMLERRAVRSIASATARYKDGGRSWPILAINIISAPGIEAAVSSPQAAGKRGSSVP
jgi:hypothetical protein